MARCLTTPMAILLLIAPGISAASSQAALEAKVVTVVGAQLSEEPKAGIIDLLTDQANVMARDNIDEYTGRTVILNNNKYKLSVIPSGILRKDVVCLLGSATIIDLNNFAKETKLLKDNGVDVSPKNLKISENATVTLPFLLETEGATGKGNSPAQDTTAIRAVDLINLDNLEKMNALEEKVDILLNDHNVQLRSQGKKEISKQEILSYLKAQAIELAPYVADIGKELEKYADKNKKILVDSVQSISPGSIHSTSPKVTSTATLGIPLKNNHVLGIIKAYATRSGKGTFPTILDNELGAKLREIGQEFISGSGSPRDCGWLDLVALKQAIKIKGIDSLALAKSDVLDNFVYVKVCIGYEIDGERVDQLPIDTTQWKKIKPVYHEFKGWKKTRGINDYEKLDENFKEFVKFIENETRVPVAIISTGPDRTDKIILKNPFELGTS